MRFVPPFCNTRRRAAAAGRVAAGLVLIALAACTAPHRRTVVTIATVNNGDMVVMRGLAPAFERANPSIRLKWVVLEENVLRQRVTTDVAVGGGQYDVVTIGNYEVPIWAKQGWLKPVTPPAAYAVADLLPPVRAAASYRGTLYALPFYAESAMTYYRTDLFRAAGLTMPPRPTYAQIAAFAARLDDRPRQVYGICLRGKPGWGENMAMVTALVHAYGGRWFAPDGRPTIDTPPWRTAVGYYSALLRDHGPPGATANGFNESLALFAGGHCAQWIDATVAASLLAGGQSRVAGRVGYAAIPAGDHPAAATWLWSWNLAVPVSSKHGAAALKFVEWATSQAYIARVARADGWVAVPPGTRASTYAAPDYVRAAPFAAAVRTAILTALPTDPAIEGPQFVAIPEYQGIGTRVGQTIAATLTGQTTVAAALADAQASTTRTLAPAGYPG